MATIKDVAKEAGVSVATVSRALNKKGYVHEDTMKKVTAAIAKLNYEPNEVARSLFKKDSKLIGLLLPDIRNPFFPELARGVEDSVQRQGYRLILGNSDDQIAKEKDYITTFVQHQVVGIISTTQHEELTVYQQAKVPTIFIDRSEHGVASNNLKGGLLQVQALQVTTSDKVLIIRGPEGILPLDERCEGAVRALQAQQIPYEVRAVSALTEEAGSNFVASAIKDFSYTAVIACNDVIAVLMMNALFSAGYNIPQDVQVVGYDDTPLSRFVYPNLTTISQSAYEMGKTAGDLLLANIAQKTMPKARVELDVLAKIRQTTRRTSL